jgi:hypothetical protein
MNHVKPIFYGIIFATGSTFLLAVLLIVVARALS